MKKFSIISIFVMVAAIVVAVVSCKKDSIQQTTNNTEQSLQNSDNMDEYLMAFKKKLLSAEKGGETISLEQAQRDLGNLLNFDFGDANYATNVLQYDTIHLQLTTTNGMVDLSQLAVTYNNAVDEITETYHNVNLPEKSVYTIFCKFNETESKDGETDDVEIVVVTRGLGIGFNFFYDTLDWKPQNHAGTCDGQHYGYGGPEVMEYWIKHAQLHMDCENGGRIYFTEVGVWTIRGCDTYDPANNCFKIYTSIDPSHDPDCITHDVMLYYYSNINAYRNQQGALDHEITSVIIRYIGVVSCNINGFLYQHFNTWRVNLEHGKPNCTESHPIVD